MGWNKVSEKEIPFGEEVIAFNEKWIDEDFNPVTPSGESVGIYQFSSDNIDFLRYYKVCSQSEWDSAIDRLNVWLKDANLKVKKL